MVWAGEDHKLRLCDIESGEILRVFGEHGGPGAALIRLDRRRIVAAAADHGMRVWDLNSGTFLHRFTHPSSKPERVAWCDGVGMVSTWSDGKWWLWDGRDRQHIRTWQEPPERLAGLAGLDQWVVERSRCAAAFLGLWLGVGYSILTR